MYLQNRSYWLDLSSYRIIFINTSISTNSSISINTNISTNSSISINTNISTNSNISINTIISTNSSISINTSISTNSSISINTTSHYQLHTNHKLYHLNINCLPFVFYPAHCHLIPYHRITSTSTTFTTSLLSLD